ncbi:uncharacterized protein LOC106158189 [Lingula anatina]|uniref:Uncharacterized protein LOC106158189 n=1 Tax=Lingula anatina TaxID=7574 RepID=A0A1S3HU43_LINAN|nr:uncharacterized protein LOC106158189 [Lingula anatina]|eukprot:XP_013389543.1 uncharacterized protein LOC106158189 [Lingula anatina]
MVWFQILSFLLLCLAQEVRSIRCGSCLLLTSNNTEIQNAMASAFSRFFNSKCADDSAADISEIQCPGSCEHVISNVGTMDNGGRPITLTLHLRRCNALRSLDIGCQTLSMADDTKIKSYLKDIFGSINRFTSVHGRHCLCNTDGCNKNTRNLPVMAPVPVTQCYKCQWRQYRSSDSSMEQLLNAGHNTQIQTSCKDAQPVPAIPSVSCRGSCGITNSTIHMSSKDGRFINIKTIERTCIPLRTASECVNGAPQGKDGHPSQLIQRSGFEDVRIENLACTCNGNGCNGIGTEALARVSRTRNIPIQFTPVGGPGNRTPGNPGLQPSMNAGTQPLNGLAAIPPLMNRQAGIPLMNAPIFPNNQWNPSGDNSPSNAPITTTPSSGQKNNGADEKNLEKHVYLPKEHSGKSSGTINISSLGTMCAVMTLLLGCVDLF